GVPALQGDPRHLRQRRDTQAGEEQGGPQVPGRVVRAGGDPLPADVRPGVQPGGAGVVEAARGRHTQPPVPDRGRTARPDLRLVRNPHPLPSQIQRVQRIAMKSSLTSPVGGRYLVVHPPSRHTVRTFSVWRWRMATLVKLRELTTGERKEL